MGTPLPLQGKVTFEATEETRMRRLARELAMGIEDADEIVKRYGYDDDGWVKVATNDFFKQVLKEEMVRWHSPLTTRERTRIKIEYMIEEALESQFANLVNPNFNDAAKVALLTSLSKIAGYGMEKSEQGVTGPQVIINIDKGTEKIESRNEPKPAITIEGKALEE